MNDAMSEHTDALNGELADDQIVDAIDRHEDSGHSDAITVGEVRDALAFIAASAREVWGTWMNNIEHGDTTVVAETSDVIVVSTGDINVVGDELNAMEHEGKLDCDDYGRRALESTITYLMHEIARTHLDRNWSGSYPWVLPTPAKDGRQYVEAVVNGLQRRGLTPGQAWAYYGVEICGYSMNQWGKRKGDHDHKNVSEALSKAKQKLP